MNRFLASLLGIALAVGAGSCGTTAIVDLPWDGSISSGFRRFNIAPGRRIGVVTNSFSDTISLVDLDTRAVVDERPLGRSAVDLDGPHHVAIDTDRGELFVALSYPARSASEGLHAAHAASVRPGYVQRLRLRDLAILGEQRIDPNPGDIFFAPKTRTLVVSHFNLTRAFAGDAGPSRDQLGTLAWFSLPASGDEALPVATKVPTCRAPHGLAASADGNTVFVACYGDDTVVKVRADTKTVVASFVVGSNAFPLRVTYGPYSVVLSPDGLRMAVGCTDSKDLRILDTETGAILSVIPTDGPAFFPRWGVGGAALAALSQSPDQVIFLSEDSPNSFRRRSVLHLDDRCIKPHELSPLDDTSAAVVCEGDHVNPGSIAFISPNEILGVAQVGVYPDRMATLRWP